MKKNITKIIAWALSIAFVLFLVLAVHIYQVTKPVHYDNGDLQLSRIDFKQDIDSAEAIRISHFVAGMPGIQNAMFNLHDRTLVYGYTLGKQNSEQVYNELIRFGQYKALRFVPDQAQLVGGCPLGKDKNSFVYKLSARISGWLN
jgi:hypothetical protein